MKNLFILVIISLIFSCSERDNLPIKDSETNGPPSKVTFRIDSINHNSAYLTWDPASDPENEQVKYSIELNGHILSQNSTERSYKILNLEELKNYSGNIIAEDIHKQTSSTTFTFQTKKYFLTFLKHYLLPGTGRTAGAARNIIKLSDGNYLVGGEAYLDPRYSAFLMKIDYNGNVLWKKSYNMFRSSSYESFKMKEVNGEIIITYCYSVAKLDLDGVLKWSKILNVYDNGYGNSTIYSFSVDSQDNIYVVGNLPGLNDPVKEKGVITKINKDGNFVWEKNYFSNITETGNISHYLSFKDIDIQNDQLYIFGNFDISGQNPNLNLSRQVLYFMKTDLDGNAIYEKSYFNNEMTFAHQLIRKKNGNYLLNAGKKILEINKNGEELWSKSIYNSYFDQYNHIFSVIEVSDNNLVMVGKEENTAVYFKTDSQGKEIWKKTYNNSPNFSANLDVLEDDDKGFRIVNAFQRYYVSGEYYAEIAIIKTDPAGDF